MWEGIFNECHYEARGSNIRDILAKSLASGNLLCLPHAGRPRASEAQIRCENWRNIHRQRPLLLFTQPFTAIPQAERPVTSRITLLSRHFLRHTLQQTSRFEQTSSKRAALHFRPTRKPHRANIYRTTSASNSTLENRYWPPRTSARPWMRT